MACTPAGIVELIEAKRHRDRGQHVVVLGRSQIVGKPAALLMMRKAIPGNATVTICHSRTKDLPSITRQADVLIAAIGCANFVTADMVKQGVTVIDVGINRVEDITKKRGYRLVGDVEFEAVAPKSAHITPVPGGVGPMTVAMLMYNTLRAFKARNIPDPKLPRPSTRTKPHSLQGPAPVAARLGLSQGWSMPPAGIGLRGLAFYSTTFLSLPLHRSFEDPSTVASAAFTELSEWTQALVTWYDRATQWMHPFLN